MTRQAIVINGATDLLVELYGDRPTMLGDHRKNLLDESREIEPCVVRRLDPPIEQQLHHGDRLHEATTQFVRRGSPNGDVFLSDVCTENCGLAAST